MLDGRIFAKALVENFAARSIHSIADRPPSADRIDIVIPSGIGDTGNEAE